MHVENRDLLSEAQAESCVEGTGSGAAWKLESCFLEYFFVSKYYFISNLATTRSFKQSRNSNEVYFEEASNILFHYVLETMHAWSVKEHMRQHMTG